MKLTIEHKGAYALKIELTWIVNGHTYEHEYNHKLLTAPSFVKADIPDNAESIQLKAYTQTNLAWEKYHKFIDLTNMNTVAERTIVLTGTMLNPRYVATPEIPKPPRETPITNQLRNYRMPEKNEVVIYTYEDGDDSKYPELRDWFNYHGMNIIKIPAGANLQNAEITKLINELYEIKLNS